MKRPNINYLRSLVTLLNEFGLNTVRVGDVTLTKTQKVCEQGLEVNERKETISDSSDVTNEINGITPAPNEHLEALDGTHKGQIPDNVDDFEDNMLYWSAE